MNPPDVVAVFNTSPDTIELLRLTLQPAGIVAVSAYTYEIRDGKVDLNAFMAAHRPKVIIYDVAPPYEANWRLLQHLRSNPVVAGVRWVITSTNPVHVEKLAGSDDTIHEVVGKPYDLDRIAAATKEALRSRPTK